MVQRISRIGAGGQPAAWSSAGPETLDRSAAACECRLDAVRAAFDPDDVVATITVDIREHPLGAGIERYVIARDPQRRAQVTAPARHRDPEARRGTGSFTQQQIGTAIAVEVGERGFQLASHACRAGNLLRRGESKLATARTVPLTWPVMFP
jgi:hypothetical protein